MPYLNAKQNMWVSFYIGRDEPDNNDIMQFNIYVFSILYTMTYIFLENSCKYYHIDICGDLIILPYKVPV